MVLGEAEQQGARLAPDLVIGSNVAGLKESSGDLGLMGRILASVPPAFAVACGSAPVLYPALCLGAVAGVLAKSSRREPAELGPEPERLLDSPTYEGFPIRALYTALDALPDEEVRAA